MTSAEHKNHFSTIEEQLESKNVVTFKWLSRTCKIHCTIAKQLLKEFVDASDKNKYSITYLVFCKDANGSLVINLTDSCDLNNAADGSSVIDAQIYSIECSSSDISTDVLYNEEKLSFQLEQMDLSSISYPSKIDKNPNLRRRTTSVTNQQNNVDTSDKPSTSNLKVEPKKDKGNRLNFTALPKSKTDIKNEQKTDVKSEDKSPKKMPVKSETESKVKNSKASKAPTGKGSLSMLFQNHRVKTTSASSTSTSNEDKESKSTVDNSKRKEQNASKTVEEKQSEKSQSVKQSSPVKTNKSQKTAKKSTAKSKKKPEKKKLKRVTAAFESSSDESDNENSSDKESPFDKMEEEPEREPEPEQPAEPEPATCVVQGKKRKRKVVSKTVMGEDGFFYTEKEVVYESCDSDDNDENDPNVNQESTNKRLKTSEIESNTNAVSKTKTVSPTAEKSSNKNQKAKTKQASIMNFFKKS